jgi:hypothetical protein
LNKRKSSLAKHAGIAAVSSKTDAAKFIDLAGHASCLYSHEDSLFGPGVVRQPGFFLSEHREIRLQRLERELAQLRLVRSLSK